MQDQGRIGEKRIHQRGIRVRQQDHVRLVDSFPAGDRRAIEHLAVLERRFINHRRRKGDVLLHSAHVRKTQIDVSDVLILDQLEDTGNGHGNLGLGVVMQ